MADEEEKKINLLHIYESLWRCRDFELSHLWQRSVFLTAFIVLAYTGYGIVIMKICDKIDTAGGTNSCGYSYLNIIGLVIALVGVILSVLWIMMGKASIIWYERYEAALYKLERDGRFITSQVKTMDENKTIHGNLPDPLYIDNSLLSTDGGRYSPSRINVILGQLSAGLFSLAYISHAIVFYMTQLNICHGCTVWMLVFWVLLFIFVWIILIYTKLGKSKGRQIFIKYILLQVLKRRT